MNNKKLIGALVAAALAIAVYYGLISQQQANKVQGQANQALGTAPASQQTGTATPQNPQGTTTQNPQATTTQAPTQNPQPTGAPASPAPQPASQQH